MNATPVILPTMSDSCESETVILINPDADSIDERLTPSAESAATLDALLRPGLDSSTTVTLDVVEEKGMP